MAEVRYTAVTHRYPGADVPAVDNLDLEIADGEFLVLVGPSGCGKSTTLRMLAGLEPPKNIESGRITIGDADVTHLPPRARDVAMVFQNYALYPNMTVAQNMGFALRNHGMSRADTRTARARSRRHAGTDRTAGPQAVQALRRAAATGGDGTCDRAAAPGVLHGRAVVESGCQAAGEHPVADLGIAAAAGHHHRLRHPRPSRGDDHG